MGCCRPGRRSNRLLISNHTRPMSWLGPASSGAHPRTKGAVLRRWAPALNTADHKGSPGGSRCQASHRGPLRSGRRKQTSRTRGRRFAEKPSGPAAGDGSTGRAHGQEGVARWATRRAWDSHAFETGCGPRETESVRRLCGRCYASAKRHAWRTRFDRQRAFAVGVATARPEWTALAGALARRCAALRACWSMGKLDGQGHAAVLRDQLRNPGGLLANEHVQRELTSLDHVECLFPHGGGAGVSNRRRHGIDQRERRIRCTDGASLSRCSRE